MRKISFLCLLIGILMGPVYKFYCENLSCREYGTYEVFSQNISTDKCNGKTYYSKSNKKWNSPIYIHLNPKMNPITFVTETQYYSPIEYTTYKTGFLGRLSMDNTPVWQEEFSVIGERKNTETEKGIPISMKSSGENIGYSNLKTFNIEKSGKYKLLMIENYHSELAISKINIIIKGNLKTVNDTVMQSGFLIIGLSTIILLLSFVLPKKRY